MDIGHALQLLFFYCDSPNSLPWPLHSAKSDTKKETRVNKKVLYGLVEVFGITAIVLPIIVVMLLRKFDGKLKINTKPKNIFFSV